MKRKDDRSTAQSKPALQPFTFSSGCVAAAVTNHMHEKAEELPRNHFRNLTQQKCHVDANQVPIAATVVRTGSTESSVFHKSIFDLTTDISDRNASTSTGTLDAVLVDDRLIALPVEIYVPLSIRHLPGYLSPSSLTEHHHLSMLQDQRDPYDERSIFPFAAK